MENIYIAQALDLTAVADAIREKGETSEQLVFPFGFVEAIQGIKTGVELNFEVVGGTTQPSNPKENTIWVKTSTAITGWRFSGTLPTSPVSGMVVFIINLDSSYRFNALTENTIHIYPKEAVQYISGAWVEQETQIYQSGAWHSIVTKANLFVDGDQCTNLTGGWEAAGNYTGSGWNVQSWPYSTISTNLHVSARSGSSQNYGGIIGTKSKVTLSGFKTLRVTGAINAWNSLTRFYIGISTSKTISTSPTAYVSITQTGSFERTLALPSGVSSAYVFILAGVTGGDDATWTNTMSIASINLE